MNMSNVAKTISKYSHIIDSKVWNPNLIENVRDLDIDTVFNILLLNDDSIQVQKFYNHVSKEFIETHENLAIKLFADLQEHTPEFLAVLTQQLTKFLTPKTSHAIHVECSVLQYVAFMCFVLELYETHHIKTFTFATTPVLVDRQKLFVVLHWMYVQYAIANIIPPDHTDETLWIIGTHVETLDASAIKILDLVKPINISKTPILISKNPEHLGIVYNFNCIGLLITEVGKYIPYFPTSEKYFSTLEKYK